MIPPKNILNLTFETNFLSSEMISEFSSKNKFSNTYKMSHSKFRIRPVLLESGLSKCSCGKAFDFALERERFMKL